MSKRDDFVNRALAWLGTKEKSTGHKEIVADYNKACDKGRKATTATAWCALFVGACAEETDNVLKDGVGVPCDYSCGTGSHSLLEKAKTAGIWVESDNYHPIKGDLIIFNWKDTGNPPEDITGHDHVGVVTSAGADSFVSTEGNKNNAVGNRTVKYNARYIRGFITPRFSDEVTPPEPTPTPTPTTTTYKVTTKGSNLRLRAEPNTTSKVVASMPNGTKVEVDGTTGGWAHIPNYKGKSGYASLTYLRKV